MKDTDIQPAPVLDLRPPAENKWQRERRAFLELLPELLQTHRDQYVAVHEGKVVDIGPEKLALAMRVYERYGYVAIYVSLVTDLPPRLVRIPTPRSIRISPI